MGDQEDSEDIKGNPDCCKVLKGTKYDGLHPRSRENECDIEINMLHRVRGLGGQLGEKYESGDISGKRSAKAMEMALRWMGQGAKWMAQ